MSSDNIIIFDGLNYIVRYALANKKYINTELMNIYPVVAFLSDIKRSILEFQPEEIYVVFDIGRDIKKKQLLDTYKKNRVHVSNNIKTLSADTHEDITHSRKILLELLTHSPIKVYPSMLVEADTTIALISKHFEEVGKKVYIYSRDKDFFQLISENINIVYLDKNKDTNRFERIILDENNKHKAFEILGLNAPTTIDIEMKTLSYFRALMGDVSDNIVGVKGCGNRTIDLLIYFMHEKKIKGFKDIDDFLSFIGYVLDVVSQTSEFKKYVKPLKSILNNRKIIELNMKLMDFDKAIESLDVKTYQEIKNLIDKEKSFNIEEFIRIATKYDINSVEQFYVFLKLLNVYYKGSYEEIIKSSDFSKSLAGLYKYLSSVAQNIADKLHGN